MVSMLVCPFLSFRYSSAKYKNQNITKLKAYLYFLLITGLPIILFIAVNLALVGIEELTGKAVISEPGARSFIILIAFGFLLILNLSVIFIIYLKKIKRDKKI